jgi:hypothetical protein
MDQPTLVTIISAIFSAGAVYGVLNNRVKALEDKQRTHDEHSDRLTRLETKLDLLLEHLIKD